MNPSLAKVVHDPPLPLPPKRTGFVASVRHALEGLVHTVMHQRNMRIHVVSAILVGLVGSGITLGLAEKVTLIFCVLFVFFAEILNSALEQLVDLAVEHFDPRAKVAKDAAAAGVLVLAIGTAVIFAAILVNDWQAVTSNLAAVERQVKLGLPLAIDAAVLVLPVSRPRWTTVLLSIGALVLWGALLPASTSSVFSALTLGLLGLCSAAAFRRN
jgi:diacylglycerol kinase (ATP)